MISQEKWLELAAEYKRVALAATSEDRLEACHKFIREHPEYLEACKKYQPALVINNGNVQR